jgi:hypothetical protein
LNTAATDCRVPTICKNPEDFNGSLIAHESEEGDTSCDMLNASLLAGLGLSNWSDVDCSNVSHDLMMGIKGSGAICCGGAVNARCTDGSTMCKNPEDFNGSLIAHESEEGDTSCDMASSYLVGALGVSNWSGVDCSNVSNDLMMGIKRSGAICCGGAVNARCTDGSTMCKNPEDFNGSLIAHESEEGDMSCDLLNGYLLVSGLSNWSDVNCALIPAPIYHVMSFGTTCCGAAAKMRCSGDSIVATCRHVMNANSWTCDASQQMRHEDDYHSPYSKGDSETAIKGECCRETCHNVMNTNSWACDAGKQMRHAYDFHNPYSAGNSESAVKGECCRESCYNVMNTKSWTCDAGQRMRREDDDHNPYSAGNSESAVKGECCRPTCYNVMNVNSWACDAGKKMREEGDFHNPYLREILSLLLRVSVVERRVIL